MASPMRTGGSVPRPEQAVSSTSAAASRKVKILRFIVWFSFPVPCGLLRMVCCFQHTIPAAILSIEVAVFLHLTNFMHDFK